MGIFKYKGYDINIIKEGAHTYYSEVSKKQEAYTLKPKTRSSVVEIFSENFFKAKNMKDATLKIKKMINKNYKLW